MTREIIMRILLFFFFHYFGCGPLKNERKQREDSMKDYSYANSEWEERRRRRRRRRRREHQMYSCYRFTRVDNLFGLIKQSKLEDWLTGGTVRWDLSSLKISNGRKTWRWFGETLRGRKFNGVEKSFFESSFHAKKESLIESAGCSSSWRILGSFIITEDHPWWWLPDADRSWGWSWCQEYTLGSNCCRQRDCQKIEDLKTQEKVH